MRRIWLILMTSFLPLFAQLNLQSIIDRDPFDPNRGQVPEVVEEVEEAPPPPPPILPVLDGTMVIGDMKLAILTNTAEAGKEVTTERVRLNESFMGYTVSEINSESVKLSSGPGVSIEVRLYSGKKTNRGGSRIAAPPSQQGDGAQIISPGGADNGDKLPTPISKQKSKPAVRPITPPPVVKPQATKPSRSNKF